MQEPQPLNPGPNPESSALSEQRSGSHSAGEPKAFDPPTVRSALSSPLGSTGERIDPLTGKPGESRFRPAEKSEIVPLPIPGERIDAFDLAESIGVGGMGAVFRALDTGLDRQVALKILPPEQASDPEVVQRFYQEGRAAARLDHENIAAVYTIGHDGRYHYIAFEYIEGTTLRQRVERAGPVPVGDAIDFTLQIADALVHASSRSVVHRDIKPSNIIITPQGRAKLVDMGLARRFERGGDDGLTQTGMTLGTFDYISPEQARDPRDVDVRSDLYSLGCTLFHMLTGRPPFPGGTVIQKLIQHQEDTPPDVRDLNPSVPDDLAAVIVRLMAKDRDRRYQSPELLVRDLLTTAGTLGPRSVGTEEKVPTATVAPPAWWERHLVWALPTLLFFLVVIALFSGGQEGTGPSPYSGEPTTKLRPGPNSPLTKIDPQAPPGVATPGVTVITPVEATETTKGDSPTLGPSANPLPPGGPGEIMVDSTENLLEAIAAARPRETLVLTDDGPFLLDRDFRPVGELAGSAKDITIKADHGVHPVIQLAHRRGTAGNSPETLLAFKGGRVTLEGLEFLAESDDFSTPPSIVLAEGTELTIKGCVFRRPGISGDFDRPSDRLRNAAVLILPGARPLPAGDRPPALLVERSHFDEGQVGILATGPSDISLRDCTFAATDPVVWFENSRATTPVPADLTLRHVSVIAGQGAVLRFQGTLARVWAEDSAFGVAQDGEGTLVETDLVDAFSWRGRGNLFARFGTYLRTTGGRPDGIFLTINDPIAWAETRDSLRESGSTHRDVDIWAEENPLGLLATEPRNPTLAFRLAETTPGQEGIGARLGPFGDLSPPSRSVPPPRVANDTPPSTPSIPGNSITGASPVVNPTEEVLAGDPGGRPTTPAAKAQADDPPEMPVMPPSQSRTQQPPTEPIAEANGEPPTPPTSPDPTQIRSVQAMVEAIAKADPRGSVIKLPSTADWDLPPLEIRGGSTLRIEAEAGSKRPRLRFRPPVFDAMTAPKWFTLFDLQAGSLQIEGVDLVLPMSLAPREGRWSVFSVAPGTNLTLLNCTLTIEGEELESAAVIAGAGPNDPEPGANAPDPTPATVRITDSLIRVGRDVVDVSAGRRVLLDSNNVDFAAGGSLVHAHGLPRGQAVERISVNLRRTSARASGGVLFLESAPGEPELPRAEIKSWDSIFATDADEAPLLRVDSQEGLESVRDKIDWEGQGNGYHQISTYRRDQSAQLGAMPNLFNRPSWTVAVGDQETDPVHGDLKFAHEWAPQREPWTLLPEDLKLSPDSPSKLSGSSLERIPSPPSSRY